MNALDKRKPVDLTVAQFLEWARDVDDAWQLRDGVPERMDAASSRHGGIQAELIYLLTADFRQRGRAWRIVAAGGVVPSKRPDRNMLIPDIVVTHALLSAHPVVADPVVIIEILSPSNASQTRANVEAFKTIPSVVEIITISSMEIGAALFRRGAGGAFPTEPDEIGPDGTLRLDAVGFAAPLSDAYRTTDLLD